MIRHCATPLVKERQLVILQTRGSRIRLIFRHFSLCFWLQPVKTMARHSTRLSAAVVLLAVACLAFQAITQAFVATSLSRRDALQAAGFAAATLGSQAVWADAQGEPYACLTRYGPQILQLKDAVDKGDMEAVLKKEPKFKLLNSYWRRNDPATYEKYVSMTDELLSAADEGKKDVVKKLYSEYTSDPIFESLKTPIKRKKNTMTMSSYGAGKSIISEWATSELECSGSSRAVFWHSWELSEQVMWRKGMCPGAGRNHAFWLQHCHSFSKDIVKACHGISKSESSFSSTVLRGTVGHRHV